MFGAPGRLIGWWGPLRRPLLPLSASLKRSPPRGSSLGNSSGIDNRGLRRPEYCRRTMDCKEEEGVLPLTVEKRVLFIDIKRRCLLRACSAPPSLHRFYLSSATHAQSNNAWRVDQRGIGDFVGDLAQRCFSNIVGNHIVSMAFGTVVRYVYRRGTSLITNIQKAFLW